VKLPDGVVLGLHEIWRGVGGPTRCPATGKLMLSTRQAHKAKRLLQTRQNVWLWHYRCQFCAARHVTRMEPSIWPVAVVVPNQPAQDRFVDEDVA
jgi:hypothetical protein